MVWIILGCILAALLVLIVVVIVHNKPKADQAIGETDVIETEYGPVRGERLQNGGSRFLGIPFAAPPIGENRFRAPRAPEAWTEPLDAVAMQKDPMQAAALSNADKYDEDCLYLNVFCPAASEAKLPVLVYVYGGSYEFGGSSGFHLETLVKETNAILVCFNYRVGPFGFLNFADLSPRFDNNLGLKDIQCALGWVHRNIASFGGDPDNVTLWGQSAGAGAVAVMLQNEQARGCFQKAFIMSNCWESYYTKEQGIILRDRFLDRLGLTPQNAEKLLELPSAEIQKAAQGLEGFGEVGLTLFRPIADGEIFSEAPLYTDTSAIHLPILIGTTNDEATMFVHFLKEKDLVATLNSDAKVLPNAALDQQKAIFSSYADYPSKKATEAILTDLVYKVPASRYADRYAANAPVWFYRFDAYSLLSGIMGLKSFHSCDLLMLTGSSMGKVGRTFAHYLANFLHTGSPNGNGLPVWNAYTAEQRNVMRIGNRTKALPDPYGSILEQYDGIDPLLAKKEG